ncbi:MAG: HTTM domain-containing protein, partial [Halobacteria archaeon]|nr:HTTM domain-containing protein [Halobacteria archaeon]
VMTELRKRTRIDTRALATFRIALGLLLLADLVSRARNLTAFYTDSGVYPREAFISNTNPLFLSLHIISGEAWFQALLFLVAGVFAVALTIGYRTRIATVASWILLVSLHNRMLGVLNGGDVLLRLLLFWAMFLPLGARWSVDSQHSESQRTHVWSVAGFALLLQVVIVYTSNAAYKFTGTLWEEGVAMEYVFSLGQFTFLLGDYLGSYPALLRILNYVWVFLVSTSLLLIVFTGIRRTLFVSLFMTMRIGLFPLISVAALIPFLPPIFWDTVIERLSGYRRVKALGELPAKLGAVLPVVTVSDTPPFLIRAKRWFMTVIPLVFLILVVLWNIQVLGYTELHDYDVFPEEAEPVIDITRTAQSWGMFAPNPLSVDGWIVAPGLLENGTRVDAFHGGSVDWDRPPDITSAYPTARWRKYLVALWRYDSPHRRYFADYLCRRWNGQHQTKLLNVTVYYMEQPTRINNETEPINRVVLEEHQCVSLAAYSSESDLSVSECSTNSSNLMGNRTDQVSC